MLEIDDKDYTWFLFALTLIFVAAKSFGFLTTWSWFMTFIPFWIVGGIIVAVNIIGALLTLVIMAVYGAYHGFKKVFNHEDD